uniref:Uncharacterized protein n=2 Tax=Oryza TaxID=4527 RepID=A0A0E0NZK7_ORYRU
MQVFFLVVGANGNLVDAVTKAPSVFAFALVQVTVHLGIVLAAGKLMGFERKPLLIASKRRRGRWRRPRRGVELADRTWDPGGHGASVDEAGGVEEGVKRSSAKRTPAPSQVPIDDGGEVDGDWGDRVAALPVVPLSSKAAAAPPEYEMSSGSSPVCSRLTSSDPAGELEAVELPSSLEVLQERLDFVLLLGLSTNDLSSYCSSSPAPSARTPPSPSTSPPLIDLHGGRTRWRRLLLALRRCPTPAAPAPYSASRRRPS